MASNHILDHASEPYLPRLTDHDYRVAHERVHRYLLASSFAKGKCVLDIPCGDGYGTAMLAHTAKCVIGMDTNREAIDHARHYHARETTAYHCSDVPHRCLPPGSIDVVVRHETGENRASCEAFLAAIKSALAPDGLLVISIPNSAAVAAQEEQHSAIIANTLRIDEFLSLLTGVFRNVRLLGQRMVAASVIARTAGNDFLCEDDLFHVIATEIDPLQIDFPMDSAHSVEPRFFLALCSDESIPRTPNTMMIDSNDALVRHTLQAQQESERLRRTLHEQSTHMARLAIEAEQARRTLDAQSAHVDLLNVRMAYLTEHRDGLRELMVAHHERLLARDMELQHMREQLADVEGEARKRLGHIGRLQEDVKAIETENRQRGAYLDHLTAHLAAVEAESLARKVYIEHLEQEWARLRNRLPEVEVESAQRQEYLQRLELEREQAAGAFADERATLQQRIVTLEAPLSRHTQHGQATLTGRAFQWIGRRLRHIRGTPERLRRRK